MSAIQEFLDGTEDTGPDAERVRRLAHAVLSELELRDAKLIELDPAVQALRLIRPLAEVEREAIEHAVRVLGNPAQAARMLDVGVATIYRKLKQYAAAREAIK